MAAIILLISLKITSAKEVHTASISVPLCGESTGHRNHTKG